jgi:phosphohistidine phosphatase SixA
MSQSHFTHGLKRSLAAVLLLPGFVFTNPAQGAADLPAMIVLVRHADKETKPNTPADAPLTPAGLKRAQDLKVVLADANLTGIITTQWQRTKDTAQPTASAFELTPEQIKLDPEHYDTYVPAVIAALRTKAGGSVLIVGHNTTVPELIKALGGPNLPAICDSVYDRLFVLVPASPKPALVQSRYGAPSPEKDCD